MPAANMSSDCFTRISPCACSVLAAMSTFMRRVSQGSERHTTMSGYKCQLERASNSPPSCTCWDWPFKRFSIPVKAVLHPSITLPKVLGVALTGRLMLLQMSMSWVCCFFLTCSARRSQALALLSHSASCSLVIRHCPARNRENFVALSFCSVSNAICFFRASTSSTQIETASGAGNIFAL